ncbi:isoaspartyl peptidase/L-asparaginase family protein [Sphingobium fuliginis]|uniref:Isoaspartyl peptidase n=1 Tax=Sphingobium fuliginis (strain ATCC 27551) TaxID=336203 RepID=A0A292ZNS8_SPHSA|nr:isoaspartyl peptidase/L-asparaginase family protein [Sphingobium fuliginis]GAY24550.1 isoaspartyl aminopeptidase [Sphingobium fuliginis]
MSEWALIVHGGAKTIDAALHDRNREGCRAAAAAGAIVLQFGGCAVAAVEAAIRVLENDSIFNAGFGSVLNADGAVEMDAAIMDGRDLSVGAVAGVRRIRNPIVAARALIPARPVLLAGEGAERFAEEQQIALCDPAEMIAPDRVASEYAKAHDTVGCVAIDMQGHIAAGTSTGGLPGKHPGRIGDSPLPGCGLYADDGIGGVSLSGDGEMIIRTTIAAHVMHALQAGPLCAAAETGLAQLDRVGGEGGAILIDRHGRFGVAHNSDHFAVAIHGSRLAEPHGAVHRQELEGLLDG